MVVVVVGEEGAAAAMIITGIHSHSLSPGQEQAWQEEYTSIMIVFLFGTPPHCACAPTLVRALLLVGLALSQAHILMGGGGAIYWHPALPWLIYL